ncbi:MAG: hypothetical protein WA294_09010 [Acidobacteriaceae bacterium]
MLAAQVSADSFAGYPPQGRALAVGNLVMIQQLPTAFAALLMSQVIVYDWLFPAEQKAVDDQFSYLRSLAEGDRTQLLTGFALPAPDADLRNRDWVARPNEFVEALTADLWSSHQIDHFRAAANAYSDAWRRAYPEPEPPIARLAIVVLGKDLRADQYPLFRKLRPHGVFAAQVQAVDAWTALLQTAATRAAKTPLPYGHWYVDGAAPPLPVDALLSQVTWAELSSTRAAVLRRMQGVIRSGHGGPEELRTLMAETTTKDVGIGGVSGDEPLRRFKLSVLTEGSGTQIFSTTFVQWTAREALRRAQPVTLVLHFQPRQRQLPMNELLAGTGDRGAVDPVGSLIDADMGTYYTWINQRRLTGASEATLIAWSEAHRQAIVLGPNAPRGVTATNPMAMQQILTQFV